MNKRASRHGFTLLELLMVVIIIAILASLALPQYIRAVARARRSEALNVMATIRSAEERYRDEHQVYTSLITGPNADLDIQYTNLGNTGSWTYTVDPTLATAEVQANGIAGTTVANCTENMLLASGELAVDKVKPDGSGPETGCQ